jgi:hypothetical protein
MVDDLIDGPRNRVHSDPAGRPLFDRGARVKHEYACEITGGGASSRNRITGAVGSLGTLISRGPLLPE